MPENQVFGRAGGGTYKLWNFYMPRSDTWRYINQKLFSNLAAEQKRETISDPSSISSYE